MSANQMGKMLAEMQTRLTIICGILDRVKVDDEGRVIMPLKDIELLRYSSKQLRKAV